MNNNDLGELIARPLSDIAKAQRNLNRRVETDPGAREFKARQVLQSITGKSLNSLMQIDDSKLVSSLLTTTTPHDSHLSLKTASDINCHSSNAQFEIDLTALKLHAKNSLCDDCARENAVNFSTRPLNPFRCWRRGHRSANYGFLLNMKLRIDRRSNSWHLSKTSRLQCSRPLANMLEHMKINHKQTPFTNDSANDLGRAMLVVITIEMEDLEVSDGSAELTSILNSQLLSSKHISSYKTEQKVRKGSIESLQNSVDEMMAFINGIWTRSNLSLNNNIGIISGAIIYSEQESSAEILGPAMRKHIQTRNWQKLKFESLNTIALNQMYGFDDKRYRPGSKDIALCLLLDPITDLVVSE